MYYQLWMVSSCQHCVVLGGQGATMEFTGGHKEILLSAVRLCRMKVPPSGALDMSESPHLTIGIY